MTKLPAVLAACLLVAVSAVLCASAAPVDLPEIDSYHLHVLFMETNNASVAQALEMLGDFVETFHPIGDCQGLFHQAGLCMFQTEFGPSAPFPTAYWAAYVPKEDFARVVPWAMQRRDPDGKSTLSIFVHPNTDLEHELLDHTLWPVWGGPVWPLDISIFQKK